MPVGGWQFGLTKGCSIVHWSRFQRTTAGRWALAARFLVQMICRTAGAIGIKATARHILRQLWRGRLTAIATAVFPLSDHKDLLRVATNTRRAAGRSHPRVLIAGVLQLPQCARYRVWQKKGYFDHLGVDCSVLDWSSILTVRSALQTHTHVIFYRVPGYPAVLDLIKEARELGLNAFWEADDLIFDRDAMLASRNLNFLEPRIRTGLVAGVPLYRAALQACGRGIASTTALAEAMCEAGARNVSVIENALDLDMLRIGRIVRERKRSRDLQTPVVIVYGPGSPTHDADFRCVVPALCALLLARPHVRLRIIGPLNLPSDLRRFADRIEHLPFVPFETYLGMIGEADINLAPLELVRFNHAKSNIKYLEAAIVGLPSVCSPCKSFQQIVIHGTNGFLAETPGEWLEALTRLVDDARLRERAGQAAYETVIKRYTPEFIASSQVAPFIGDICREPPPVRYPWPMRSNV